jgi:hypothetical protein
LLLEPQADTATARTTVISAAVERTVHLDMEDLLLSVACGSRSPERWPGTDTAPVGSQADR